jgi:hypothetical protein
MNGGVGQQLQHTVRHRQTCPQNGDNRYGIDNLNTIKLYAHGGLDNLAGNLQSLSGLEAQIEGDLLELSSELIGSSVHISELRHFGSDERVFRLVKRHIGMYEWSTELESNERCGETVRCSMQACVSAIFRRNHRTSVPYIVERRGAT